MNNSSLMSLTPCPVVRWVPLLAATFGLAVAPRSAEACFFYEEPADHTVVDQTAMQIVLKQTALPVEGGDPASFETTMILGAATEGYVPDLGWIVAVPRYPTVDVAPESTFSSLDFVTAPIFRTSSGSGGEGSGGGCGGAVRAGDSNGFPEDTTEVTVWQSTVVGPYAVEVLTAANVDALRAWVETNGFPWRPETEADFAHYIELGYFFVASKVRPSEDAPALLPLALTYETEDPVLVVPVLLTRAQARPDMGLVVWILADRPAVPRNWQRVLVPEARIVVEEDGDTVSNYGALVAEIVDAAEGGQAFVTEYIQPAAITAADILDEPTRELVGTEGFVTRLYSRVDPEDVTTDPTFTLDASAPLVPRLRDLTQVEGGQYWGAAFRPVHAFAPLALLLLGRRLRTAGRRRSSGSPRSTRRGPLA
jgi:hypothetical protein